MIKTFKQYVIILPIYLLLFIGLAVISLVKVDYTVLAPAYNDNIADTIYVPSEFTSEGTFHTTSVMSLDEISILQKFVGDLINKADVSERPAYYDDINDSDMQVMNVLMKDDSIQTSLIVGFSKSDSEISFITYPTVYLTYTHLTKDSLEVGDYIVSVNGNTDIYAEMDATDCDVESEFNIIRNGVAMDVVAKKSLVDDRCVYGMYTGIFSEIQSSTVAYRIYDTNTGGPSGGLMQSLYIFNQLTETDYSNGLKIGGTGTIDVDGNVGYIGGVRQKIITAIGNDIDIFFIPYLDDIEDDNYIEALLVMEEFETDMILVGVSTFDEALEYLENYGETNE